MKNFIIGFVLGACLFGGISAIASVSAGCYGTGPAAGWTVENGSGDEICDTPDIWAGTKTIECSE